MGHASSGVLHRAPGCRSGPGHSAPCGAWRMMLSVRHSFRASRAHIWPLWTGPDPPVPPPAAGCRDVSVHRQDRLAGTGGGLFREGRLLREGRRDAPRGERLGGQGRGGARPLRPGRSGGVPPRARRRGSRRATRASFGALRAGCASRTCRGTPGAPGDPGDGPSATNGLARRRSRLRATLRTRPRFGDVLASGARSMSMRVRPAGHLRQRMCLRLSRRGCRPGRYCECH